MVVPGFAHGSNLAIAIFCRSEISETRLSRIGDKAASVSNTITPKQLMKHCQFVNTALLVGSKFTVQPTNVMQNKYMRCTVRAVSPTHREICDSL